MSGPNGSASVRPVARFLATAGEDALRELYADLRRRARQRLLGMRLHGETSTTSLVHDAVIKLSDSSRLAPRDDEHFLAVSSLAMRQILLDRVRRPRLHGEAGELRDRGEGGGLAERRAELLALHQALERLRALDPRAVAIVELHFFGGVGFAEIAAGLGLSERTVLRDWRRARALLHRLLGDEPEAP